MKDEFVMVPHEWAERVISAGCGEPVCQSDVELLSAAVKAEHHQGEPVALPARKSYEESFSVHGQGHVMGWNDYLDEIAKLGPLYTHPGLDAWQKGRDGMRAERDAVMKERDTLRAELNEWKKRCQYNADTAHDVGHERDTLRAQLAERDALLRKAWRGPRTDEDCAAIDAALSASAEPSAAAEIDERAEFEADVNKRYPGTLLALSPSKARPGQYANLYVQSAWDSWQARATLGRKP